MSNDLELAIARGAALRDDMQEFFSQHLADLTAGGTRVTAADGRDVTAQARRETQDMLDQLAGIRTTLDGLQVN